MAPLPIGHLDLLIERGIGDGRQRPSPSSDPGQPTDVGELSDAQHRDVDAVAKWNERRVVTKEGGCEEVEVELTMMSAGYCSELLLVSL
jgi:hypothetical protein